MKGERRILTPRLWLMDLHEEFNEAREYIRTKYFFPQPGRASTFETIIRHLGGFITIYELSGDPLFLDKAVDVALKFLPAFHAQSSSVPNPLLNVGTGQGSTRGAGTSFAEMSSFQLEFLALAKHTGNMMWAVIAARVNQLLEGQVENRGHIYREFNIAGTSFSGSKYSASETTYLPVRYGIYRIGSR